MIDICCSLRDERGTYSKYMGTMMCSLLENTDANVCFHMLHDETLTPDNREKFNALVDKYKAKLIFYPVDMPYVPLHEATIKRFTKGALYRLLIPSVLSESIDKVLYLDADIVVNRDIKDIWKEDIKGYAIAAFLNYSLMGNEAAFIYFTDSGIIPRDEYINSGIMLMDLQHLRNKHDLLKESFEFFEAYPDCRGIDQDAINYILKGKIKVFGDNICQSSVFARKYGDETDTLIYHFVGDSPRDTPDYTVDKLFINYLRKTPWGNDDFVLGHYGRRIIDKDKKIQSVYKMMDTLRKYPNKKVIYWGAGGKLHAPIMMHFTWKDGDYYVDNNRSLWGKTVENGIVYNPDKLLKENKDSVIIINTIFRYSEVKRQLEGYGYEENVNFFNGRDLLPEKETCLYFGERSMPWDI